MLGTPSAPTELRRRKASQLLNLSSNELIHPGTNVIAKEFTDLFSADLLTRYPVTADIACQIARYVDCDEHEVVLTPGSDLVIRTLCTAHALRTGGRGLIILQDPNYAAWEQSATRTRLPVCRIRAEQVRPGTQGERLAAAAVATSNAVIAVSVPGAPVGGCLTAPELDTLAAIAAERGHLLVIDACYQAFNGEFDEFLRRRGPSVLVIQSLSKSHALAGARVGLAMSDPLVLRDYSIDLLEQCVAAPSLLAAKLAIEHHDDLVPIWADIGRVRDAAAAELVSLGLSIWPSGGNFLAFDTGSATTAKRLTESLADRGYRIRDLSVVFGFAGHLRFTVPHEAACRRFLDVLRSIPLS